MRIFGILTTWAIWAGKVGSDRSARRRDPRARPCTAKLSEAERYTLQQRSLNHRQRDFRTGMRGVLLTAYGRQDRKVAHDLEVACQFVCNWMCVPHVLGMCSLLANLKGGRKIALPETMLAMSIKSVSTEAVTVRPIAQHFEPANGKSTPCRIEALPMSLKRLAFPHKRATLRAQKNAKSRSYPRPPPRFGNCSGIPTTGGGACFTRAKRHSLSRHLFSMTGPRLLSRIASRYSAAGPATGVPDVGPTRCHPLTDHS